MYRDEVSFDEFIAEHLECLVADGTVDDNYDVIVDMQFKTECCIENLTQLLTLPTQKLPDSSRP